MGFDLQKDDALEAARLASKPAPTTKPVVTQPESVYDPNLANSNYGLPADIAAKSAAEATAKPIVTQPESVYDPNLANSNYGLPADIAAKQNEVAKPLEEKPVVTDPNVNKDKKQTTTTIPPHIEDKVDKIVSTNIPGTAGSNGSSFNYDSSQDPAYKQAAANLENQIVQSMVGRGGLYSSVTQQEVQNGLQNLEVQFREQRHSEWMAERDQVLQEAQFALTKSESEYSRWRDRQASASKATSDALDNEYANLSLERARLDAAIKRFEEGKLTSADASLLGFPGVNAPRSIIESAIASKERAYQTKYASYMNRLEASDNAEAKLALADETRAGSATSEEPQFTTKEVETLMPSKLGTSAQASAYRSEYSKFITGASDLKALEGKLSNLNYNSASLIKTLGDALYYRLVYEAEKYYDKKANA